MLSLQQAKGGINQTSWDSQHSYKHGQRESTCTTVTEKHTHGVGHNQTGVHCATFLREQRLPFHTERRTHPSLCSWRRCPSKQTRHKAKGKEKKKEVVWPRERLVDNVYIHRIYIYIYIHIIDILHFKLCIESSDKEIGSVQWKSVPCSTNCSYC